MKPTLLALGAFSLVTLILAACNIYAPFNSASSDADLKELALKCLHDGDYDCAVAKYSALSDATEKAFYLCTTQLGRSGFTLSSLVTTIKEKNSGVLGSLAKAVAPYTDLKGEASAEAATQCAAYNTLSGNNKTAVLLNTLSQMGGCSLRMAKSAVCACSDNTETTCTTRTTAVDIDADAVASTGDGSITGGSPGMCKADVEICRENILSIDPDALDEAGLGDIRESYDQIPEELRDDAAFDDAVANATRKAVADTLE